MAINHAGTRGADFVTRFTFGLSGRPDSLAGRAEPVGTVRIR
jgi:hypothetical protein